MGIIRWFRRITGTGIGLVGGILWLAGGLVSFVWALNVLFDTFGAWTIIIGLILAPITYIASIFIVWFTTDAFPFIMLIPYLGSFVGIALAAIGGKVMGEETTAETDNYSPKKSYQNSGMNWFQRHLNWTFFLAFIAVYPISFITGFSIVTYNPYVSYDTLIIIGMIIPLLVLIPLGGWVLKRKGRSLEYLLLLIGFYAPLFIWVIFLIIFLTIENHRLIERKTVKEPLRTMSLEIEEDTKKDSWVCDKCGGDIIDSDGYCLECFSKVEQQPSAQDGRFVLEENKPYLHYRPHNCPYCNSTKISESVRQVAKNEKEKKLLGYSYLWEGKCADCYKSWYSVEGGKQASKLEEPIQFDETIKMDIDSETNFCFKCGRAITPEMTFCPKCGYKIS